MARPRGVRYRSSDNTELQKAVNNFNRKRARLISENPALEKVLPAKASVRDIKQTVETRGELNRQLNTLKRFSKRGSEQLVTTKFGETLTRFEVGELRNLQRIQNIKKASARRKAGIDLRDPALTEEQRAKFAPTKADPLKNVRNVSRFKRGLLKRTTRAGRRETDRLFKDNYFKALDLQHGADNANVIAIKNLLKDVPEEVFARIAPEEESTQIQFIYEPQNQEAVLTRIREVWQLVKQEQAQT